MDEEAIRREIGKLRKSAPSTSSAPQNGAESAALLQHICVLFGNRFRSAETSDDPQFADVLKRMETLVSVVCEENDVNGFDSDGYTALHCCVLSGALPLVDILLHHGADASIYSKRTLPQTPIQMAILVYRRHVTDNYDKKDRHAVCAKNLILSTLKNPHPERDRFDPSPPQLLDIPLEGGMTYIASECETLYDELYAEANTFVRRVSKKWNTLDASWTCFIPPELAPREVFKSYVMGFGHVFLAVKMVIKLRMTLCTSMVEAVWRTMGGVYAEHYAQKGGKVEFALHYLIAHLRECMDNETSYTEDEEDVLTPPDLCRFEKQLFRDSLMSPPLRSYGAYIHCAMKFRNAPEAFSGSSPEIWTPEVSEMPGDIPLIVYTYAGRNRYGH